LEQYFDKQPYEVAGVIQKKYFLLETHMGPHPDGGERVKLEVMGVIADKVEELSNTHLFVRMSTGSMPVLRLK
jgi:hypothetical protein